MSASGRSATVANRPEADLDQAQTEPRESAYSSDLGHWENSVVLCPIALAVGCKKCPAFPVCPVKTVIGDYRPDAHPSRDAKKPTRKRQK
jgi:hypothetical protein